MRRVLIGAIVSSLCLSPARAQPASPEATPAAVKAAERTAKELNDKLLATRSAWERHDCLRRLNDLHPDVAVLAMPGVVGALANKDNEVVKAACNVVIRVGEPAGKSALPALMEVLATKYEPPGAGNTITTAYVHDRAYWAIATCANTDPEKTLPLLTSCLKHATDRERRRAGAHGIQLLGPKAKADDVKQLALERVSDKNEDHWVKFSLGVYFWETHQDKRGVGMICLSLMNGGGVAPANDVEYTALNYLKQHKPAIALEYLSVLTKAMFHRHHNASDRCAAVAEVIGTYGEKAADAVPDLAQAVAGQYPARLRFQAAVALAHMGAKGKDAVPVLTKALKDRDSGVDLAASYALARIEPSDHAHPARLLAVLNDQASQGWARSIAVTFLGRLGPDGMPPEVRDQVLAALKTAAEKATRPADKLAALQCRWLIARDDVYLEHLRLCLKAKPEGPDAEVLTAIVALGAEAKPLLPELRLVRQKVWAIATCQQVTTLIEALEARK